jgi:hypothetical protein
MPVPTAYCTLLESLNHYSRIVSSSFSEMLTGSGGGFSILMMHHNSGVM